MFWKKKKEEPFIPFYLKERNNITFAHTTGDWTEKMQLEVKIDTSAFREKTTPRLKRHLVEQKKLLNTYCEIINKFYDERIRLCCLKPVFNNDIVPVQEMNLPDTLYVNEHKP